MTTKQLRGASRHRDARRSIASRARRLLHGAVVLLALPPILPASADSELIVAQAVSPMSPMEWDTDRPGLDYSSFELAGDVPALCQSACSRDAQCKAWTYVRPRTAQGSSARCWLKYAVPGPQPNACCVSGTKRAEPKRAVHMNPMEWDFDRPGGDYRNFNLPYDDPGLCQSECQSDARCKAWTYVRPDMQGPLPRCWLKERATRARSDSCCVSGTKRD